MASRRPASRRPGGAALAAALALPGCAARRPDAVAPVRAGEAAPAMEADPARATVAAQAAGLGLAAGPEAARDARSVFEEAVRTAASDPERAAASRATRRTGCAGRPRRGARGRRAC